MSQIGNSDTIKVSASAVFKTVLRRVIKTLIWTVIVLFLIYLCFAATLWRVVPSFSGTGPVLVKNITSEGGFLNEDVEILVGNEVNDNSVGTYLSHAFVPSSDYFVARVVAGPFGEFDAIPERNSSSDAERFNLAYEGMDTDLSISSAHLSERDEEDMYLNNEYIVECVSGDCVSQEGLIISSDYIMGEVLPIDEIIEEIRGDRDTYQDEEEKTIVEDNEDV